MWMIWLIGGFSYWALPCPFSRLGAHKANTTQPLFSCENEPTPGTSQPHHGKHYILSPILQTGETQNKPHTKQQTPLKKGIGKKNPNNSRHEVWSCTAQHTHSGMEKKGMFEGCGMTPAPGTAWQWVNRLWLRGCAQKQEGLRISQPAKEGAVATKRSKKKSDYSDPVLRNRC